MEILHHNIARYVAVGMSLTLLVAILLLGIGILSILAMATGMGPLD